MSNVAFCVVAYVQRVTVQGNFLPNFVFTPNVPYSLYPQKTVTGPRWGRWRPVGLACLTPHSALMTPLSLCWADWACLTTIICYR